MEHQLQFLIQYFTYIQNPSLDTIMIEKRQKRCYRIGRLKDYNTALHLDNKLTVQYLKKIIERKNIKHVSDTVFDRERDETSYKIIIILLKVIFLLIV